MGAAGEERDRCAEGTVLTKEGFSPPELRVSPVPFKLNQGRRHHIPRRKHQVTNWPAYEAGLRQRGSVTVWFTDEAIAAWEAEPRTTRGGQPCRNVVLL
jgi:hypothetical protein